MHFGVLTCRHVQDAPGLTKGYDAGGNRAEAGNAFGKHTAPVRQTRGRCPPEAYAERQHQDWIRLPDLVIWQLNGALAPKPAGKR